MNCLDRCKLICSFIEWQNLKNVLRILLKTYNYKVANKECKQGGSKQPDYFSTLTFKLESFSLSKPLLKPSSLIYCSQLLLLPAEPPVLDSCVKGVRPPLAKLT